MSRRTQLTTKFTFALLAQLSENFIFIYLGLSLFTETTLEYKPLFILVTVIGICVARWCAVFPLSAAINWFIRYRARRRGQEQAAEEIPTNWKILIFWAGLRGAVGVALAAGLTGQSGYALKATVLVVVVLTVIIFGGTTARMLEILNIRTGVVDEIDSDDEFDIEPVPHAPGVYAKRGAAFGHTPKSSVPNGAIDLNYVNGGGHGPAYSTAHANGSPPHFSRRNSSRQRELSTAEQGLLSPTDFEDQASEDEDLDLPPAAQRRSPQRAVSANPEVDTNNPYPIAGARAGGEPEKPQLTARGAINSILNATSEDAGNLFSKLDENFLKPHLLLDPGHSGGKGASGSGGGRERSGSRDRGGGS